MPKINSHGKKHNKCAYFIKIIQLYSVPSGINPYVWGNYQHAVENVTLAQSQKYNITSAGYGINT